MENDMVNYPAHYQGKIQCIDAIEAMLSSYTDPIDAFLTGQVFKYIWRHPHKGKVIEDLEKAEWYLKRLIKYMKESEVNECISG